MAVIAFYNETDCDGLAANIKSKCKTHGLTSFTEVWPTACRCVQRLAVCCETGGFCIIAEISTVCKKFHKEIGLTHFSECGIITIEKALRQAVGPIKNDVLGFYPKNRHFAEWRFLLFTTMLIVMVLRPT